MAHSLRVKIKGLRYKGIITDKDCDRLCKALDNEDVLEHIQAEILDFKEKCNASDYLGCGILEIIDKYKAESEDKVGEDKWNIKPKNVNVGATIRMKHIRNVTENGSA